MYLEIKFPIFSPRTKNVVMNWQSASQIVFFIKIKISDPQVSLLVLFPLARTESKSER